jgi:predicted Zn-dependent protease
MTRKFVQLIGCFMALLGAMAQLSAAHALPLIRDAEIEHTLRTYGDPVFKAAGLNPQSINLFIVQNSTINAFVAGGSNMFIHTGLIMETTTPDMLIGVMAHEAGHIAGGHLARGAEKLKNAQMGTILSYVMGAAAAAATGKAGAAAAVITGTQTSVMRNVLAFSRSNEQAADQSALKSLEQTGVSASGLLKVLELLRRNERSRGGSLDPYMLTHPLSSERIDHIRNTLATSKIAEGAYPSEYKELHERMVAKLYGFIESPERTLQKYPKNNPSIAARMARAVAYHKMPDLSQALTEMDNLLKERPNDGFLHELRGQILFEHNRIADALSEYQKASKLIPDSALILTELANVEIAQNNPALLPSAITNLERSAGLDKNNSTTWRRLAIAYGKTGNQGMAALALAEEALLEGDYKSTLQQVAQATSYLKSGTPSFQRAQDIRLQAIEMKKEQEDSERPF